MVNYNHPNRPAVGSTESIRRSLGTSPTVSLLKQYVAPVGRPVLWSGFGSTRDLEIRRAALR